jgi:hypothetical protein
MTDFPNCVGPNVIEVDGPPMAYFEIPYYTPVGDLQELRIEYISVCLSCKNRSQLEDQVKLELNVIKCELEQRGGGIIWWRHRSEYEKVGKLWVWYARLQTSPEIPDHWWAPIRKLEGEPARFLP